MGRINVNKTDRLEKNTSCIPLVSENFFSKLLDFRYSIGPIIKFTTAEKIIEVQEMNLIIPLPVWRGIQVIQGRTNDKKKMVA